MIKKILMSVLLVLSTSALAIDPSDMPMYEDNYMDFSVTIGDRINGVTHISCVGGCTVNAWLPSVVNVCSNSSGVCERTRGPVTTEPSPVPTTTPTTPAPTTTPTPAP